MSLTCSSARNTVALAAISAARLAEAGLATARPATAGLEAAGLARPAGEGLAAARGIDVGVGGALHAQGTTGDAHLLQVFEQFAGHAFGQVDQGEIVADVD